VPLASIFTPKLVTSRCWHDCIAGNLNDNMFAVVSCQLSVVSCQLSVITYYSFDQLTLTIDHG